MNEHLVAARAAVIDLIEYHRTHLSRAEVALAALADSPLTEPPSLERPGTCRAGEEWVDQASHIAAHVEYQRARAAAPAPAEAVDIERDAEVFRQVLAAELDAAVHGPVGIEPAVEVEVPVTIREDGPLGDEAQRAAGKKQCECGRWIKPGPGFASHQRRCEQHRAAVGVAAKFDADVELAKGQDIFRCDTCTAVFTKRPDLSKHTILDHGRGPTHDENTPLADRQVTA